MTTKNFDINGLVNAAKQSEIVLALGVIFILTLLFVPIPAGMLDFMFTINITTGVVVLLTVLFVDKAMEFSAFPMLLLITTMLRLSLNVASTRLILSKGHETEAAAGKIIETFGELVMGGQFIIGLIIFLILVIVNFVVITKGSGRIAEVAARFTLDSLPGKQMAIDADLNAGLITEDQARERRSDLEQETGFFGAMDGASKFVRGDAIAGLIITALNITVGMGIGIVTHDMSAGEAADRYMLLTVGDGLVAQIPALIISTSAGILVAKSGAKGSAGEAIFSQIADNPKSLYVAAGLMFFLSLLPNMPILPFWFMAGALGGFAYYSQNQSAQEAVQEQMQADEEKAENAKPKEEPIASILHIDTLRLELGYGLLTLIDEAKGGKLTEQIKAMRRQMARDMGFVVPSIRIQDNMQLDSGGYQITIKDIKAGSGTLHPTKLMAMDPTGSAPPMEGEETIEPTFGLPAKWIDESKREEAGFNGYTVVDCATVITTHLTEIVKDNLAELLTRNETEKLLEEIRHEHDKLIDDLIPNSITISMLQKVLQNLLSERISIRDLPTILESLSDGIQTTRNITQLTEMVRQRLSRQICTSHQDHEGVVNIVALSGAWEKEFSASIHIDGDERQLAMEPTKVQQFIKSTRDIFDTQMMSGIQPVLLTSPSMRPFVRSVIERSLPSISVMSQAEIHPRIKIKTVASI
ncbi:MAG: flagellar biosynthesis protein FlhA [Magnetococcales bacterium]|nr:flagellar biosynthesis protein FlhA [Magnetococcales bacterium]